jgi:tyrosyl-tRNA synthetase
MDVWEILEARGFVQQSTDREELARAVASGAVTVYAGFDPTADSLHVGHLLPIMALAWFQRCGHRPVAVVGGGTALVGDPSGKTEMRQMLTEQTIAQNLEGLRRQLERFLVLDGDQGMLVDNAEWLMQLQYIPFLRDIGRHFSVNRMLAAETYKLRLEKGLSFIEFNYQILQAYDYLELHRRYGCTVQLGGDDQWSNILAGADLIRRIDGKVVHALTLPLITTASGEKMGKTAAGAVWLDPRRLPPFDFYQYWLNVDDRDTGRFLRLYTFLPLDEVQRLEQLEGADIREAKRVLARETTRMVHGDDAARAAEEASRAMASGQISEDLPNQPVSAAQLAEGVRLSVFLADAGLVASRGEARRLIENGGVRLGNDKVSDPDFTLRAGMWGEEGMILRIGKKRAVRLQSA